MMPIANSQSLPNNQARVHLLNQIMFTHVNLSSKQPSASHNVSIQTNSHWNSTSNSDIAKMNKTINNDTGITAQLSPSINTSENNGFGIGLWQQIPNISNLSEMALCNTKDLIFHRIAKTGSSVVKAMLVNKQFVIKSNINYQIGFLSNTMMDKKHNFVDELLATENISSDIYISHVERHFNKLFKNCLKPKDNDKHCIFVTHMLFVDENINISNNNSIISNKVSTSTSTRIHQSKYHNLLSTFDSVSSSGSSVYNNINKYKLQVEFITFIRNPLKRIESLFYYLRGISGGWRGETISFKKTKVNLYQLESNNNSSSSSNSNLNLNVIMYNENGTQIQVNKTVLLQFINSRERNSGAYQIANVLKSTKFYGLRKCIDEMETPTVIIEDDIDNNVCRLQRNYMTRFFCGQNERSCNVNNMNQLSLNQAINNLNKYFAFVGILEHFDVSIYLLQLKFPHILKWKKFENIFKTDVNVVLQNTNDILKQWSSKFGYGAFEHPKLVENSKEYQYLVEQNKLDVMLFNYVNQYYESYIIPSLQL